MSKMEVKRQILASQISVKRTLKNEQGLERELSKFFKRLQKEVLSALHEYWSEYQLLRGQIDLIVAPVHEAHREYYEILEKYVRREYKLGVAEAKRNVERLNKKNRVALKAVTQMPIKGFIQKGDPKNMNDWFATIPKAEKDLLNRTFRASEQTMSRVDNQINKIITDGYRGGKGINDIGAQLNKRFDQLSSWEARRIARTEVNTSHNVATVDTYRDMGVEYTQWIAAHDDRTRDSHAEVDGEIIPMGGKYSNGLEYPGDMSGDISEWINCRCSNAPFVIPFGYMAPSFSPFRESDLIPIIEDVKEPTPEQLQENLSTEQKALYNKYQKDIQESRGVVDGLFSTANERLQAQHTIETTTIKLNQLKSIATGEIGRGYATFIKGGAVTDDITREFNKSTEEWDINRLTSAEKEQYLDAKHNYIILKEAIETGDYSKLDNLRESGLVEITDKKTFMELTENGRDLEIAKIELEDYQLDIDMYEKIIKDTNIVVESLSVGIKWNRPNFQGEFVNLNDKGKYEPLNLQEKFKKYYFKKEKLTIYESVDMDYARVRHIHKAYKELPDHMKKASEIVLSNQVPVTAGLIGNNKLSGYVLNKKGSARIYQFKKTLNELKGTLRHESAHLIERDLEFFISNSKEYVDAFYADRAHLKANGYTEENAYVTPYARFFTENAIKNGDKLRPFSEDFAESVKFYLKDKETFIKMYPNKAKVIEKAINGELTPKNTVNYWKWKEENYVKYELTEKELDRYMELDMMMKPWAQNHRELTKSEKEEYQYYKDKRTFDYLYKEVVKGEELSEREVKEFMRLQKKYKF